MEHVPVENQPLDFEDFANQLLVGGSQRSPAWLHGGICGVLANSGPVAAEDCLAATGQALDMTLQGELAESCLQLAGATMAALEDESFGFHLFLPGDEVELELRVQALSEWCHGFLAGYAWSVPGGAAAGLDSESGESLGDIAAIAQAGVDAEADDEESESHFFELSEYLRFAMLHLYMSRQAEQLEQDPESPDTGGLP